MVKWTPQLDSAHQIGLSTSSKGKLIIVGECVTGGGFVNRENRKNGKRFCLLWKNWWCYYETDTTVGFSASNRSIYILKRKANGSWGMCYERVGKLEKSGKSEMFLLVEKESVGLWLNGQQGWIQRIK